MTNTTTLSVNRVSRTRFALALLFAGIVNLFLGVLSTSADAGNHGPGMGWNWNWMYLFGIVWILIAILVAKDATARGENGLLWGLVTLLMPIMGIFFYLVFISLKADKAIYQTPQ